MEGIIIIIVVYSTSEVLASQALVNTRVYFTQVFEVFLLCVHSLAA